MTRRMLILCAGLALAAAAVTAGEAPDLSTPQNKEAYVVGYEYGVDLLSQGLRVDPDAFLVGLKQAQQRQPSALSSAETAAIHRSLATQVMGHLHREYLARAAKELEVSRAFLAENAAKEGVHTLPSGLQYKVLVEGSGPSPKETDLVTMNYRRALVDGTEFDTTYARGQPVTVDVDPLIPGWREALLLMKVGSKWQLFLPAELAYGQEGSRRVPPNSAVIFEVELLSIGMPDKAAGEPEPVQDPAASRPGG
jgi:FKBP-type peptidyl-prolyl cis-trans isomerase FklB